LIIPDLCLQYIKGWRCINKQFSGDYFLDWKVIIGLVRIPSSSIPLFA